MISKKTLAWDRLRAKLIYWVVKGDLALFAVCGLASAVFLGLYASEKKSK